MADVGGTSAARTVFQIEDSDTQVGGVVGSGEFVDIRCDLSSIKYNSGVSIAEERTFCGTQKDYDSPNGNIALNGLFSGDVERAYRLLKKAQRAKKKIAYKYGPEGSDTGDYGLSGIAIVGDANIDATVRSLQKFDANLGIDGDDVEFTWS